MFSKEKLICSLDNRCKQGNQEVKLRLNRQGQETSQDAVEPGRSCGMMSRSQNGIMS